MLLRTLRREVRAVLHHAMSSWLSTPRTGRAIRKRRCCIRSSRNNWKLSSPDNRSATVRCSDLLKRNSAPFWIVEFSRGGRSSHTKYSLQDLPPRVEVTRRHHPLYGQELEVIRANKVVLTIRLPDSSTMKMPRAWTNAAGETGVVQQSASSVFTAEGVRDLIMIVGALSQRT
jgi:hypothetical protein